MIKNILKLKGVKLVFVTGKEEDALADFTSSLVSDFLKVKRLRGICSKINLISILFYDLVILTEKNVSIEEFKSFSEAFREVVIVINSNNLEFEKELIRSVDNKNTVLVDFKNRDRLLSKRMNRFLSYGFDSGADFFISDITQKEKTNFKINYDGSSIPVWIGKKVERGDISGITAGLGVGVLLDINFVKLTQKLNRRN